VPFLSLQERTAQRCSGRGSGRCSFHGPSQGSFAEQCQSTGMSFGINHRIQLAISGNGTGSVRQAVSALVVRETTRRASWLAECLALASGATVIGRSGPCRRLIDRILGYRAIHRALCGDASCGGEWCSGGTRHACVSVDGGSSYQARPSSERRSEHSVQHHLEQVWRGPSGGDQSSNDKFGTARRPRRAIVKGVVTSDILMHRTLMRRTLGRPAASLWCALSCAQSFRDLRDCCS